MSIPEIQKIKWRCRLGMLELDLLFGGYVDKYGDSLTSEERQLLANLLEEDNDVLERWLITEPANTPTHYQALCRQIVASAVA